MSLWRITLFLVAMLCLTVWHYVGGTGKRYRSSLLVQLWKNCQLECVVSQLVDREALRSSLEDVLCNTNTLRGCWIYVLQHCIVRHKTLWICSFDMAHLIAECSVLTRSFRARIKFLKDTLRSWSYFILLNIKSPTTGVYPFSVSLATWRCHAEFSLTHSDKSRHLSSLMTSLIAGKFKLH